MKVFAVTRAVGMIGAAMTMMVGSTFALNNNQAALMENSLAVASGGSLAISRDGNSYNDSVFGFTTNNLTTEDQTLGMFWLRNGDSTHEMNISATVAPDAFAGLGKIDPTKVDIDVASYVCDPTLGCALVDSLHKLSEFQTGTGVQLPGTIGYTSSDNTRQYYFHAKLNSASGTGTTGPFNIILTATPKS